MNYRSLTDKDHEAIQVALWKAVAKAESKDWISSVDLPTAYQEITSGKYIGLIVEETYLVMADIVTPWYAAPDNKTLAELLVLRVYDGPGKFDSIPRVLQLLAETVGAGAIVVGTALTRTNRALQRMYARHGFQVSSVELFKNLKE
jgi:hypothetical protein